MKKCNNKRSFEKLLRILGLALSMIMLAGSLGVTFVSVKACASSEVDRPTKIVNTTTSESLEFDGYSHQSTVYAGEIKKNGETTLCYLYSEDITRAPIVFDNLRKAIPNPFSDMVPVITENQTEKGMKELSATTVNSINLSTLSGDWTDASKIVAKIYSGKKTTDAATTNMYDVNEQCKSDIDGLAKDREENIDNPIKTDKRVISHLGTKSNDEVIFTVVNGHLVETHNVDLIYLSEATTLIYTTVNVIDKTDAGIAKAPQGKTLTYNGQAQGLATAGTANGGTMQYALGTATKATGSFTTSIPTATNVGTYYVWYKVIGDGSHNDIAAACVKSTIKPATAKVTKAPTAKKLTYNGKAKKLVVKGTASNGKMYYAVTKNTTAPKASKYKTSIPTGKAAGTYYVWYKAKGNTGYKDSAVKKIKVTIAKKVEKEPFTFDTCFKVTQTDGAMKITWDKVKGLSKADVYVDYCGVTSSKKKYTTTTKNTLTIKKIAGKKIDLTKDIKLYMVGYDSTGKKTKKSVVLHIAGKDSKKFTNVKSFKLEKNSVSLKRGKSTKVKVTSYKLENSKLKELSNSHGTKLRYRSTNPKVAKVNAKGKITAVKEGKCKVYVYTRNGLSRKVTVTVTK